MSGMKGVSLNLMQIRQDVLNALPHSFMVTDTMQIISWVSP